MMFTTHSYLTVMVAIINFTLTALPGRTVAHRDTMRNSLVAILSPRHININNLFAREYQRMLPREQIY